MSDPANIRPDAFAGTAEAYARWRPPYPTAMLDELLRGARVGPNGRLLDLATGPGRIALALAPSFAEVWAQDLEPEMVAVARAAAECRGIGNISWFVGSAEHFDAPEGHFDLITIGEAFHRVDQQVVAAKARRWLKPGGAFVTLGGFSVIGGYQGGQDGARPWQIAVGELTRRFTAKAFPTGWAVTRAGVEPGGAAAIRAVETAGLALVADRDFTEPHAFSFEAILGYLHSTSVASRQRLGDDADAFAAELKATLAPFAGPDGLIREEMSFGYTLFRNPG